MIAILHSLGMFVADLFKSRCRLEAENLFLRHQLSVALRRAPPRLRLRGGDRALLIWMTRLWPSLLDAAKVVQPETILRWHRSGFKAFWRWKSRKRAGRPKIDRGLRDLIRRMSKENQQWGASRIHGELLMLGFEVAQSTVSKYIVRGFARTDACLTANPRPISLPPTGVHRNATACERARVNNESPRPHLQIAVSPISKYHR